MKNRIRLTESQLHQVIKESVKRVLKESVGNKWTEQRILDFVDRHGGEGFSLVGKFPFSPINKQKIKEAYEDEDNYTDSDLCDYIIELAIEQVNSSNF